MKLTPLDLRKQQFRKTFRGYDPDEVRGFIEKLAQDWEEVLEDKRRGDERVALAEEKLRHYEKVELALQEALEAARETGRRAEDAASQRARLIIEEAELRAQRILQDAEQERYNIRQDLVKLNSRQSEIAARLRAFLMSEMEILAQFQGDDPIGFIKLVAATEGAAQEALPGPRARLGPAAPAPEPEEETAPAPEQPSLPFDDEAAAAAEAPAAPQEREETPVTELVPPPIPPLAAEEPAPTPASEEAPVSEEAPAHEPAPAAEVPPPPPPVEPTPPPFPPPPRERPSESPAVPTYRDWLSGLATRHERSQKPSEEPVERVETEEREREASPFGHPFFRPSTAEPPLPAEPAPTSDAARGWSLRSLVTGDREEGQPSVAASDDERERIRRILEDLD
ncbi:MAG TPA: DivIVA domain-containing protein [Rubricoccaceae bacterium]|nr:DivIVA domain-containing protein [Rubricoccaceae bacterium]